MPDMADIDRFLAGLHPYDSLDPDRRAQVAKALGLVHLEAGEAVYTLGAPLDGLYIVVSGEIEVSAANGTPVSLLGPRNSFGERGLLRDGGATTTAVAAGPSTLYVLPAALFHELREESPVFAAFFERGGTPARAERRTDIASQRIGDLMTRAPVTGTVGQSVAEVATRMRERRISALPVMQGAALAGIVTTTDLAHKVVAEGLAPDTPVEAVMTPNPMTMPSAALVSDVQREMLERGFRHMLIAEGGALVGIVSLVDLGRRETLTAGYMIEDIVWAKDVPTIARSVTRLPDYLVQLVGAGNRHDGVTRLVTDIGDAVTRRLLALAEAQLGPPPVPYLWLACGSQGRREQTGVSDQDNCLILSDEATDADDAYFEALARFVCDGLDACGYVYCPGDMMATNPRWRQPLRVWRGYFDGWIRKPDPMAQMLASVMFDLRPIGGETALFDGLQAETLASASRNSIFVAHMIANSLKHTPPLGLFRGFATIRSGEHRHTLDLKHNGVVPVVDLARVYALQGRIVPVNTRARLETAAEVGAVSASGGRDLIDAYDLIAETRLEHQAARIRAGDRADNFMAPSTLSDFERSHLRDAFVVVKTMQSALGHSRGTLS